MICIHSACIIYNITQSGFAFQSFEKHVPKFFGIGLPGELM